MILCGAACRVITLDVKSNKNGLFAAWLLSPPLRHQTAHQHSQQEPDRTGDDEMAEREFLPAFAAPAIPFSGGDECLDGFDAGAVVHGGSLPEITLIIHSLTRYRRSN